MSYTTLITCEQLEKQLNEPELLVVDCRFNLVKTEAGREAYEKDHIPGAIYAHLDDDLSGEIVPGTTGRHPLPEVDALANLLSRWGVTTKTQIVAYDDTVGAIASRLWWMLQWVGHKNVAVLNGGYNNWQSQGKPCSNDVKKISEVNYNANINNGLQVEVDEVYQLSQSQKGCIVDARTSDRFCGENETLDPIGGHIPGAINAPFVNNIDENGKFKSKQKLAKQFENVLGQQTQPPIIYCGSGVTAAHNILAMAYAGVGSARLYAGSWSHWITDENRPIETCSTAS